VGTLLFEETITAENYPNPLTQFVPLLEGNAVFSKMNRKPIPREQQLSCRTFSVIALSGVEFGHVP
jgi:hypothetical protein